MKNRGTREAVSVLTHKLQNKDILKEKALKSLKIVFEKMLNGYSVYIFKGRGIKFGKHRI